MRQWLLVDLDHQVGVYDQFSKVLHSFIQRELAGHLVLLLWLVVSLPPNTKTFILVSLQSDSDYDDLYQTFAIKLLY